MDSKGEKRTVAVTAKFTETEWARVEHLAQEMWPRATRSRAGIVVDLVMIAVEEWRRRRKKP